MKASSLICCPIAGKTTLPEPYLWGQANAYNVAGNIYQEPTLRLRATAVGSSQNYELKITTFACVAWSCLLSERTSKLELSSKLIKHSGLICLDIDKIPPELLIELREKVKANPYTFICFISPNGNGLKIVIKIDLDTTLDNETIIKQHEVYWKALETYYDKNFNQKIDKACKNVDRLCCLPWDPDIYVNEESDIFYLPKPIPEEVEFDKGDPKQTIVDFEKKDKFLKQALNYVASAIDQAVDGEKLTLLLKMSELLGGYVTGGFLTTIEANDFLKACINSKANVQSYKVAYKAIEDAIEHGKKKPITLEEKESALKQWINQQRFSEPVDPPYTQSSDNIDIDCNDTKTINDLDIIALSRQDERGDAELLSQLCKGNYLYDHISKHWMIYKKGVWIKDEKGQARKEMIHMLISTYLALSKRLDDEIVELTKAGTEQLKKIDQLKTDRDHLRSRVKMLNKRSRMNNIIDLATSYLPARTIDFDQNPYLLNLLNGTYNFHTSTFHPHSSADKLSKQISIKFTSNASYEKWLEFLNLIFNNDKDLIRFIQKCIGISLTGFTDLQALLFCYGKGANGKTTFFALLKMLLGDYFCPIPIDTLLVKQRDSTTEYQLAKMRGARVVVASEIPEGRKLQESQVKDLTGGDMINARQIFEKPFSFVPTHKLWMFGNHKPIITGTDHGIWRRIYLIPFSVTIPKEKQRPMTIVLNELKEELSGIINWAIEGYNDYVLNGLEPPQIVQDATKEYKTESDALSAFFDECCMIGESHFCTTKILFDAYINWCKEEGESSIFRSSRQLPNALRERGFKVTAGNANATTVLGITLKPKENKQNNTGDDLPF